MLRLAAFLAVTLVASASPLPSSPRILEGELTAALQKALAAYDPVTIQSLTDLHIDTPQTSIVFNANDITATGFAQIVVTKFTPPVPLISKAVTLETTSTIAVHANDYSISGTFQGEEISASGTADLTFNGLGINIHFKAESYSLIPVSLCIKTGSLAIDLSVVSIDSELEGAGDINDDLEANGPAILELVQDAFNKYAPAVETFVNVALCV